MRILRNYILRECILPFSTSLGVLTGVFLLGYLPQLANSVINKGVSLSSVGIIFLYYIPILLGYTLPVACLVTVILTFGRMSSENEILAMRASGIHIRRLITPLVFVGMILSLFVYLLNDRVIPTAFEAQTKVLQETGSQNPTALLEAGTFINAFDKYIVFIYRIDGERLYGIRIYQPQPKRPTRTIIAQEGEFVKVPNQDKLMLKLINGTSDEPDMKNPNIFYKLNFQQSFITMDLSKRKTKADKKPKAMTMQELTNKIDEYASLKIDSSPLITEIHRRMAWSLVPLLFILIGFPFAIITHQRAKSANLLYALLFGGPYYLLSLACQGMAAQNMADPALLMWVPNIIFGLLVLGLNWKLCVS